MCIITIITDLPIMFILNSLLSKIMELFPNIDI